jgi:hypothetical protein
MRFVSAIAIVIAASSAVQAQTFVDNFDDGDDAGWTRFDPLPPVLPATPPATFTFPNGGYRMVAGGAPANTGAQSQVFSSRGDIALADGTIGVDIKDWSAADRSTPSLIGRATPSGSSFAVYRLAFISGRLTSGSVSGISGLDHLSDAPIGVTWSRSPRCVPP